MSFILFVLYRPANKFWLNCSASPSRFRSCLTSLCAVTAAFIIIRLLSNLTAYQKKCKYIEDYYNQVVRQKGFCDIVRSEMIVERALERFQETGRDLLCPESTKIIESSKQLFPISILENDEIYSSTLSDEEKESIDSVLLPISNRSRIYIPASFPKISLMILRIFVSISSIGGLASTTTQRESLWASCRNPSRTRR